MEDKTAIIIAIASIINLGIIFHLTEPFFLVLGASLAGIITVEVIYILRRKFHNRRQVLETRMASEGKELRIEYSGLPTKFHLKELEDATSNFSKLIGKGASGSVFKGMLCDGMEIVVKRIQHGEDKGGKEFRSEIAAIASVQHLNLVRLFGYCVENNNVYYLVYDFIPNGSLGNWIYSSSASSRGFLSWKQLLKVACDVAKTLAYLHHDCRSKVLHLDVFTFGLCCWSSLEEREDD